MAVLEVFRIANGFDSLGNTLSTERRPLRQPEGDEANNNFGNIFDQALFKDESAERDEKQP